MIYSETYYSTNCITRQYKEFGKFMKKLLLLILFVSMAASCNAQSAEEIAEQNGIIDTNSILHPQSIQPKETQIITRILSNYHYEKPGINDSVSAVTFNNYIDNLDHNKLYFLKEDIDRFEKYRFLFDDDLINGNLEPAFDVFNTYKKRLNERMKFIIERLNHKFNYDFEETYDTERKNSDWAENEKDLNEVWRKKLKHEALSSLLNNKDWEKTSEQLSNRYKNFHKIILQYKAEDVYQLFLNSFADALDPHTNYFSPKTAENFKINMSLSLEGIGATLMNENDYTKIVRIIPGGPADGSKKLFENDRIVGVAQGEEEEMVDVIGWRVDDVVQLIRGKKGTKVRLQILRADDTHDMPTDEIIIVRDKIKLEEQAAKKKVFSIDEDGANFKLGVIELPTFYNDFEARSKGDEDFKSTTRDVKRIIGELKEEKVDGIIIDLRDNGGGSLQEAIELTGLFIKDGPVVQVRNSNGLVEIGDDPDPGIFYDGPLAVMVNRNSASASEIFSGAIQDYGRGVVIGERTYGKGTVQNLINLSQFIPANDTKLGQLKLTIAKYYRITGSSTQRLGIIPDILYPTPIDANEYGESSRASALKWDRINSAQFKRFNDFSNIIPEMMKKHAQRIRRNPEFHFLIEEIEEFKENKNKTIYSLNFNTRKAEKEEEEEKRKKREELRQQRIDLKVVDKNEVNTPEIKLDDPLLEEGGRILADLILMSVG